ncbi:hypothetical protein DFR42_104141 [Undibacterium pigrum]|uniref:Uncharacterized protein n=1 Tax=Undibacterium pigrum TaxID=401470 RepID=A0A318J993_9BURK|nr:hypothetical protein DFR42_104141 [Undibacterium pigrum]
MSMSLLRRQEPSGVRCTFGALLKRLPSVEPGRVSARRPKFFLCVAKERIQRKATQASSPPEGGSRLCSTKNGKARNSPAAQTAVLLFPFSVQHKRRRHMGTAERQKQLPPQRQTQQQQHPPGSNPYDLSKLPTMARQIKHWPS